MSLTEHYNPTWSPSATLKFLTRVRTWVEGLVGSDDHQAIADTMEGISEIDDAMNRLLDLRNDCLAMAAAKKERAKEYAAAAKYDEERAAMIEDAIHGGLKASLQTHWKGLAGSVRIHRGSWSTEIIDAENISLEYMKAVPDIAALKGALRARFEALTIKPVDVFPSDAVPGARLVRGPDGVTITKPKTSKTKGDT